MSLIVKIRTWGTLRCCVFVESDDQINLCTGYLHRFHCWSHKSQETVEYCTVSYVTAIWSLFSTPANVNPPLQSQCEGCLLWLTTKLTKKELAAVWTGRQMRASVCFASRWISTGRFSLPDCPILTFHCRTIEISCLLVKRSGVYENCKRNQKDILSRIKSSWTLWETELLVRLRETGVKLHQTVLCDTSHHAILRHEHDWPVVGH